MLAFYSDDDDFPTEQYEPYIVTDKDLEGDVFKDEETNPCIPSFVLDRAVKSVSDGDLSSAAAWKEIAIKQGIKPNGHYRLKNL